MGDGGLAVINSEMDDVAVRVLRQCLFGFAGSEYDPFGATCNAIQSNRNSN